MALSRALNTHRDRETLVIWLLALGLPFGLRFFVGDSFINPMDEGFLWYGVVETATGGVPLRDFQAYQPGRYYLLVALTRVFGDGLLGLRTSLAVVQSVGLAAALFALKRVVPSPFWLIPIAFAISLWQQPHFKIFESTLSLIAVLVVLRFVERPDAGRSLDAYRNMPAVSLRAPQSVRMCLGARLPVWARGSLGRIEIIRPIL